MIRYRFLFNFAVSYGGGGLKRLYEYAKWFNLNGGAWFIIHPRCNFLIDNFPNNRFFIVNQSKFERMYSDCRYLNEVCAQIGVPELYYSYGIPVYYKVGRVNWFHLSNVLPLSPQVVPLTLFERLQMTLLGHRINNNLKNVDIVSAESNFSLDLIHPKQVTKLFLSVNGSDDELELEKTIPYEKIENIATVIGTYRYKAIEDSYRVFEMLQKNNSELKLVIIGHDKQINKSLKQNSNIIFTGRLPREDVIKVLRKTRYYISTTHIENASNASSEGVFIARESYISDIAPHRELLAGMLVQQISVPNMTRLMLHVKREDASTVNLKKWDGVITEMLTHVEKWMGPTTE